MQGLRGSRSPTAPGDLPKTIGPPYARGHIAERPAKWNTEAANSKGPVGSWLGSCSTGLSSATWRNHGRLGTRCCGQVPARRRVEQSPDDYGKSERQSGFCTFAHTGVLVPPAITWIPVG